MNLDNDTSLSPANFQRRLVASFIDILVANMGGVIIAAILFIIFGKPSPIFFYLFFIVGWALTHGANAFYFQIKSGRTLGKLTLGMKVCYPNEKLEVRDEDIIKREAAKLFTLVTFGYSFFNQRNKEQIIAFHDEYSDTVVLNLTEKHEAYLFEHFNNKYYFSEDEEEEYAKLKAEQLEFEKQEKERLRQLKEYERQLKKEQQAEKKRASKELDSPNENNNTYSAPLNNNSNVNYQDNAMMHQQSFASNDMSNANQQMGNNFNQPQQNPSDMTYHNGYQNVDSNMFMTNANTQAQQSNYYPTNVNQPQMTNPQPQQMNTLNTGFEENEGKKKGKLFGGKKGNKGEKANTNYNNKNYNDVDAKLSDFVQDNSMLPSTNPYSEFYKGWSIDEVDNKINKLTN